MLEGIVFVGSLITLVTLVFYGFLTYTYIEDKYYHKMYYYGLKEDIREVRNLIENSETSNWKKEDMVALLNCLENRLIIQAINIIKDKQ